MCPRSPKSRFVFKLKLTNQVTHTSVAEFTVSLMMATDVVEPDVHGGETAVISTPHVSPRGICWNHKYDHGICKISV